MITGLLLPSSRFTFFFGAAALIAHPTSREPVNVIIATSSCSTRRWATRPLHGTTLIHPAGRPASSNTSARAWAHSGVVDAGFSTTGHPAATAGPSLWATRFTGKLNG